MTGPVIIVDRARPGDKPEYCIHGQSPCVICHHWCWLGDKTYALVFAGLVRPLCHECAARYVPKGTKASLNIHDHRRADGPHRS